MTKNCSNLLELKCDLITGITEISHKLKVKYAIVFLFLLGSTLSIPISPILAASDIDNDGILDDVDNCPRLQEDYFGDIDGCPSKTVNWNDSDFDAIPDDVDQCITLRENYNGYQDEDGCPDDISVELVFDHDSDSIPDLIDNCPLISETYNNFQDEDGCPDYSCN